MGGLEESIGMLTALSDMIIDVRFASNSIKRDKSLEKDSNARSSLMYNLCVIKIGIEILRLKFDQMDELTRSQFSKIDTSISEMSDEILDLIERQESMVN